MHSGEIECGAFGDWHFCMTVSRLHFSKIRMRQWPEGALFRQKVPRSYIEYKCAITLKTGL